MILRPAVIFAFLAIAAVSHAADPLTTVFEHIDAASKTFKGMTANISDNNYTALVDDSNIQTGTFKLLRVNPSLTRLRADVTGHSGSSSYALNGPEVRTYNPTTKIVSVYDFASKQGAINQFLLLGFGATSTDLKAAYKITWVAEEKIGGVSTSHLKLIPTSTEVLRTIKQADLWFGENGLVVQQKLLYPAGDYRLVTYSNMNLTPPKASELDLNPKGAKIQVQGK